jgi:ankyrin repeat protein
MGADPNATRGCADPTAALLVAARAGLPEYIKVLLEAGASVLAEDAGGENALHWACRAESLPCVRVVLDGARAATEAQGLQPDDPESPYWRLLGRVNSRSRTPCEVLPRSGRDSSLSYAGNRISALLRPLEVEAQHKLLDSELLSGDKGARARAQHLLRQKPGPSLAPPGGA